MINACDPCGHTVLTKTVLNKHKLFIEQCSSMRSIFDHCDYKVYTKTIVNKHKPTKQEEWIHLCDDKVLTKTVLKKHKVSMHEGVG